MIMAGLVCVSCAAIVPFTVKTTEGERDEKSACERVVFFCITFYFVIQGLFAERYSCFQFSDAYKELYNSGCI